MEMGRMSMSDNNNNNKNNNNNHKHQDEHDTPLSRPVLLAIPEPVPSPTPTPNPPTDTDTYEWIACLDGILAGSHKGWRFIRFVLHLLLRFFLRFVLRSRIVFILLGFSCSLMILFGLASVLVSALHAPGSAAIGFIARTAALHVPGLSAWVTPDATTSESRTKRNSNMQDLQFKSPIDEEESNVLPEAIARLQLAVEEQDVMLALDLEEGFKGALIHAEEFRQLNQYLIPNMAISSNRQYHNLLLLLDEIDDALEKHLGDAALSWSWSWWEHLLRLLPFTPDLKRLAQNRQQRLHGIIEQLFADREAEFKRLGKLLKHVEDISRSGGICNVRKKLLEDTEASPDMQHTQAVANILCSSMQRSDSRWKGVIKAGRKSMAVVERLRLLIKRSHRAESAANIDRETRRQAEMICKDLVALPAALLTDE